MAFEHAGNLPHGPRRQASVNGASEHTVLKNTCSGLCSCHNADLWPCDLLGINTGSKQALVFGFRLTVEAAGFFFESVAVENPHGTAIAAHQAFAFEVVQSNGDARPPHAKHER
jgi:hypothetical protein